MAAIRVPSTKKKAPSAIISWSIGEEHGSQTLKANAQARARRSLVLSRLRLVSEALGIARATDEFGVTVIVMVRSRAARRLSWGSLL